MLKKQSVLSSPRLVELEKKKQKKIKTKIIIILIIFFLVLLGISFTSRIPAFNINNVIISGNKIIETKEIKDVVETKIAGHYLWLFPKTNFIIYPKNKIKTELENRFKRIKDIFIDNKDIKTLKVSISEYEGKYLWCGILIPVLRSNLDNNKCYFLDSDGYIFDEAPYFSGSVYFKLYGNSNLNEINPSGSYFLKNNFSKIIEFKNTIEKLDLKPTAFWIDENREEGNFSISGEPGISPKIIFKIDGDYQKLVENLQAAISTEPLRTDLKNKFSSLLYIDLRFGNKVYYKFQ